MQRIIEKIKSDTGARVRAIKREQDSEIEKILKEARAEAVKKKRALLEKASKEAETEKKRIVSIARLTARKEEAMLADSLLEEIISEASENLEGLRKEKAYAKKLTAVVQRAVEEIPASNVVVEVSPQDSKLLKLKRVKGKTIQLKKSGASMTGAVVKNQSGSVRINCTFKAILEEKKPELKKELMAEIKGEKKR